MSSSLSSDLAEFRKKIQSQPIIKKDQPVGDIKKPKTIALPPAFTVQDTRNSNHILFQVISLLKDQREKSFSRSELQGYLPAVDFTNNRDVIGLLQNNARIRFNAELDSYQYKPDFEIRSKEDLLDLLLANREEGGMEYAKLKDVYADLPQAIEELEAANKLLVFRHNGAPRVLFYTDPAYNMSVSKEFQEIWDETPTPLGLELSRELGGAGLKETEVEAKATKLPKTAGVAKKKRKSTKPRSKFTNKHLSLGEDV